MKAKLFFICKIFLLIIIALLFFAIFFIDNKIYVLHYREEITKYSTLYNLNSSMIASIIKVESNFDANAKSQKGALGLMQLMPNTAEYICELIFVDYDESKLIDPEYNVMLGTYYFKYLLNKFKNVKTSLVAYNAGEGNATMWLKDKKYSSDGSVIEITPYQETNAYVSKVLKFSKVYSLKI